MRLGIVNLASHGISGGYRRYLDNLINKIAKDARIQAVLCAYPAFFDVKRRSEGLSNVTYCDCKAVRFPFFYKDSGLRYELERFSPDVIFSLTERPFEFKGIPVVTMLQNMEPFVRVTKGNPARERIKLLVLALDARRAILRSTRVIAISKFVKDFLVRSWKLPEDKIGLVYPGVAIQESIRERRPRGVPQEWGESFLFTAGSIRPSRGLEDILLAIKFVIIGRANVSGLVVAGLPSPGMIGYRGRLQNWVADQGVSGKVCWAGHLDDSELAWCYRHCLAFVMTSRVESFGMVGSEAMANGCVCIASESPCLPEIFGDAAIYYPPGDAEVLSRAIEMVATWDKYTRMRASDLSRREAGRFSWDVCASKTVSELQKALPE
jgi:glycosyltransferase involved in cell wall biosynthesis